MDYETIACDLEERILTVTLNRSDRMNAFTVRMSEELEHVFGARAREADVSAVIVTGAGKAFCAGMDLSVGDNVFGLNEEANPTLGEVRERFNDPDIAHGVRDTGGRVALAIYSCPKPVIAAVNGTAVGIGSTMTLAMDFRLASTSARFGFVFSKIGIVPEACSTWFLPRLVGIPQALEWLYSGRIFPAEEAKSAGLVQAVHEPDQLLLEARALAKQVTQNRSMPSTALTRQMILRNSAAGHPVEAHIVESLAVLATSKTDGKEGVSAFLEKRDPNFRADLSSLPSDLRMWLLGTGIYRQPLPPTS